MTNNQGPHAPKPRQPPEPSGSDAGADSAAEYGPRGYVPPKAAARARKIVLREPMGMGWPIASVVAGVLLALLGVVWLLTQTGPPGPPWVAVAEIDAVDPRGAATLPLDGSSPGGPDGKVDGPAVLVVRAGGGVRAFAAPGAPVHYCPESRRLEAADGSVWSLDGARTGGDGPSLTRLPVQVHDGTVHVDPSRPLPPPASLSGTETPACATPGGGD